MVGKLRHVLIFLLIILKEPNMPEAGCSCESLSPCKCRNLGLTSIPQNLPTSISELDLESNRINTVKQYELLRCGSVAGTILIGTFLAVIWYKKRTRHPPLGPNPNVVGGNTNTSASVMTSGDDHQYKDIDNGHDQTVQGQSQAVTESLDWPVVMTRQGRVSLTNTESNTNTTATVVASGHDQTEQGQSQTNTESNTNTTATAVASGHDKAGQGQSKANAQSPTNFINMACT
ncbi:PREDICTED: uncharacterized protein LOC109487456 [Branchiostoma belcheri]|uniref:Uncharacterized protein LOC109487456 n=1 Tax=Branchiostoma belcheri TaxID=7741 RepID=A0A6P5AV94_BRABE|nr:PREDICTED: uncharacterized protein LOC109487456 [Branchiostoma belcheri]